MSYSNSFPPEIQHLIAQHMASGGYADEDALLRAAFAALAEREAVDQMDDPAVIAGIRRGLAEADAGLGRPLAEFDAEFRARHGMPRHG